MTETGGAPGTAARIAAEIRALRKGRGMQASDLTGRMGPNLLELSGHDETIRRRTLVVQLNSCAAQLAPDLRLAITASLGLSGETRQMPYFRDRASWLAAKLGRDYRTALRRIENAELLLAEEIAEELRRRRGRPATAPNGWYLDEFRAVLRLDTHPLESHEYRRIVSARADLTEVMAWLDVPRVPGQPEPLLSAEILYGGRLVRREEPYPTRFQFVVQLPVPLQAGQEHEFGMILRMREGEPLRPHCIITPECQCNAYDLRVRFDPEHLPGWVRRVDGETVRMFDAPQPNSDLAALDQAGEIHVQFRNLTMYLGYGVQWQL